MAQSGLYMQIATVNSVQINTQRNIHVPILQHTEITVLSEIPGMSAHVQTVDTMQALFFCLIFEWAWERGYTPTSFFTLVSHDTM